MFYLVFIFNLLCFTWLSNLIPAKNSYIIIILSVSTLIKTWRELIWLYLTFLQNIYELYVPLYNYRHGFKINRDLFYTYMIYLIKLSLFNLYENKHLILDSLLLTLFVSAMRVYKHNRLISMDVFWKIAFVYFILADTYHMELLAPCRNCNFTIWLIKYVCEAIPKPLYVDQYLSRIQARQYWYLAFYLTVYLGY